MKIPNKLKDFIENKEQYIQFIKNNKNCCSSYYQGDDMFVLKNGYIFYWKMGLDENYFQWKLKITEPDINIVKKENHFYI